MKIIDEKSKLPKKNDDPLPSCENCSIQSSMGLSCYHLILECQQNPGVILSSDIDSHWHYDHDATVEQKVRRILLEPTPVKGKGRPRGTKDTRLVAKSGILKKTGKNKGVGESSTLRDPLAFEYADYLPSSTAPPEYHQNS